MKISVAIATYNEALKLETCLASVVAWVDEIVVVDGGSTDRTVAIATHYHANIIKTNNPPIFHINKQKALDQCKGEWILQLDADEVVSEDLKNELISIVKRHPSKRPYAGYYIPRKNFFLGHWMHKGGQYPDYVIRFFLNGTGKFPCRSVHEQIAISGEVGYCLSPLLHYSAVSLREYWKKANVYIDLLAHEMKHEHIAINLDSFFFFHVSKPVSIFFALFIRHKGFMDGLYGFLFAFFSACHYPLAYRIYRTLM